MKRFGIGSWQYFFWKVNRGREYLLWKKFACWMKIFANLPLKKRKKCDLIKMISSYLKTQLTLDRSQIGILPAWGVRMLESRVTLIRVDDSWLFHHQFVLLYLNENAKECIFRANLYEIFLTNLLTLGQKTCRRITTKYGMSGNSLNILFSVHKNNISERLKMVHIKQLRMKWMPS